MARFNLTTAVLALLGASQVQSQCTGPNVNAATISLITEFEGWYPNIYIDPVGLLTVGYGHLCADSSCSDVRYPIPLSRANGEQLLRDDIAGFQNCITLQTASSVVLNANQYGALVSWAFNVGCGATRTSTLIQRLNAGGDPNTVAAEELPKWNRGGGQVLPGLTRRRAAEVALHRTATSVGALPACS
ncbi:Endolysin like protein [Verticillium longisporum]|uniref:Endolysin like protein n=1 Tax=Verticillium longisporum TaxID=100787 RepID=A0A8I2ZAP1_VERLO|nr:Endolysin like protein [Verticillium longisporum]